MYNTFFPSNAGSKRYILQWHLSDRCNLKCQHCYQEQSPNFIELPFATHCNIIEKFANYIGSKKKATGQINLAGGEPFLLKNIEQLIAQIYKHRQRLTYSILSNGTLISEEHLQLLQEFKPLFVQISIDGSPKSHDSIRGKGSYKRAIQGLKALTSHHIRTIISFTAHKANFKEFPQVVKLAKEIGVNKVWTDRLIPSGRGKEMSQYLLSPDETYNYSLIIKKEQLKAHINPFCKTKVASNRALQFIPLLDSPYSCSAGKNLLALLANGNIVACRRLPVVLGNIIDSNFHDYFQENTTIKKLHTSEIVSSGCERCLFKRHCKGGLKCLSNAVYGSPDVADPGCWRAEKLSRNCPQKLSVIKKKAVPSK